MITPCSDYARVLNIPQYSYKNIIILTNVIILEFLSVRFIHQFRTRITKASKLLINFSFWLQ